MQYNLVQSSSPAVAEIIAPLNSGARWAVQVINMRLERHQTAPLQKSAVHSPLGFKARSMTKLSSKDYTAIHGVSF